MSYAAPSPELPFPAQVELASLSDGLKRWARLRLLWRSRMEGHGEEDGDSLAQPLEDALAEAEAHAQALASFYEKNAEAVNALIAAAMDRETAELAGRRARQEIAKLGDDPAAALASRARGFAGASAQFGADDGLCGALFDLMLESWVCCQAGVEASCGTLWGELYERHCN